MSSWQLLFVTLHVETMHLYGCAMHEVLSIGSMSSNESDHYTTINMVCDIFFVENFILVFINYLQS